MAQPRWGLVFAFLHWAFVSFVNAQGYFLKPFSCSPSQNFQELGCYNYTSDPFNYFPRNAGANDDPSMSYPLFDTGGIVNSTVEPAHCSAACRAHGFKYAGLGDRYCRCSTRLGNLVRRSDQSICNSVPDVNPCGGDKSQNCGQPEERLRPIARIFVDPSFEPETSLALDGPEVVAQSYGYLGCFSHPNSPSADPQAVTNQPDALTCQIHCAEYGFPLSFMRRISQ